LVKFELARPQNGCKQLWWKDWL